jgi:sugar/nucleoside kinase (ribokinase family)
MFDVITLGSATRDIFFITDKGDVFNDPENLHRTLIAFEFGDKVEIENVYITDGGGACNTATAFARLGLKTKALMRVGDDESGEVIVRELDKDGGDSSAITFDKKLRTGISAIIIDKNSGERTVLFYPGANLSMEINDISILDDTKWLYIAPLTAEKPIQMLPQVCNLVKDKNTKIAFNPSSRQLSMGYESMKCILKCSSVLIVNLLEAEKLVSSYLNESVVFEPEELLTYLQKMGPDTCVLTLSSKGSIAISGGQIFKQPAADGKSVDTTGAGDAFSSTFVAGLNVGYSIPKSLKLASLNAASVISRFGAQEGLLTFEKLSEIFKSVA